VIAGLSPANCRTLSKVRQGVNPFKSKGYGAFLPYLSDSSPTLTIKYCYIERDGVRLGNGELDSPSGSTASPAISPQLNAGVHFVGCWTPKRVRQ
jgi:hypothetical protein